MKRILNVITYYALIPFVASLPGLILSLFGLIDSLIIVVPLIAALIYIIFRKKTDLRFAALVNGIIALILLAVFTIMMAFAHGNVDGVIMSNYTWFILPFAPILLSAVLMGQNMLVYLTAFLTFVISFIVCAILSKTSVKKYIVPILLAVVLVAGSTWLYMTRPQIKYGGHGFRYMNGYSSTDFRDYMVTAEKNKLAVLDHAPAFMIENEEDMPVLDGAEACYPLYAAFAKAMYKDIDKIEKAAGNEYSRYNGKIVSFSNTVVGLDRLSLDTIAESMYGVDMFFGARPSREQFDKAEAFGTGLEVTPIAREAFIFFVEEDNPVDNLTSEEIRAIYHGDITNWKEVGGKDSEIIPFQRPKSSGSQTMMEYFMGNVSLREPKSYEIVDAMTGVIKRVAEYNNEDGALGYSFRYFLEVLNSEDGVKMLSVDGVYPSLENIENGTYPLTTNVCMITRAGDDNPNVEKMKEFILSDDGQEIIRKTGYAPLK